MSEEMMFAIQKAKETMNAGMGGPFGATIIDKSGNVVSVNSNSVLRDNDPTAHAEINAIREACKKLDTYNLEGCTLYSTSYPCPMCMSAIIWSNIKKVVYGCSPIDAENIGFRDEYIYNFIKQNCDNKEILDISQNHREECIKLFEEYKNNDRIIY